MIKYPTIIISSSKHKTVIVWKETLDEWDYDYFIELQTNGANKHIERITWEHWTRPIKCELSEINKFNKADDNAHFIFGYIESLAQSDRGRTLPLLDTDIVEVLYDKPIS